jgi:hypothetical protein
MSVYSRCRTPGFPVYPGLRQARPGRARAPTERPSYPATELPELPSDHSSQLPDRSDPATQLPSALAIPAACHPLPELPYLPW